MPFKVCKPGSREGFTKDDHNGHLVAFVDAKGEETSNYSGDGTQLVAVCAYVVCVTCRSVFADQRVYGEVLAYQIVDPHEEVVGGHLGQSKAKPGRNPAWVLEDPTVEDETAIQAFLDQHATRMPSSNRIVIEQPAKSKPNDDESF
jgi:hypothetical protein